MVHYLPDICGTGMLNIYALFMGLWVNGVTPVQQGICVFTIGFLLHV